MKDPSDAIVAVTHRCNARCVMCNVWKNTQTDVLQPLDMRKLPPALRTVNLTGGEPFLRPDLPEFVRQVRLRCPDAQITISTNAYLPDRIDEIARCHISTGPGSARDDCPDGRTTPGRR